MPQKNKDYEDKEQEALFQWARIETHVLLPHDYPNIGDWLFAIPNGGKRNVNVAKRLKAQGVKAGVWDVFFPFPVGQWPGLWIEMKKQRQFFPSMRAADTALSDTQLIWGLQMELAGYSTGVAYGWEEARQLILGYLNNGR